MEPGDGLEADDRLRRRPRLAAAVRVGGDLRSQERSQFFHVAIARGGEECGCDLKAALPGDHEARTSGAHVHPCAAGELATGRRLTANGVSDFIEVYAEHVVQKKGRPLQWRQALKREHERKREVVDLVFRRLDNRVWEPRTNIGFAPAPCGVEMVEAEARHDAPQPCFRFAHRGAVSAEPAEESLLNDILRIRDRSQHPIGDACKPWAQRVETGCGVFVRHCDSYPTCTESIL
jgi:hypothetical protein